MSTWFQNLPIPSGELPAWFNITEKNSFRVVSPSQLPATLPNGLTTKCASVLVMRSGSLNEEYIVANLYRIDKGMIDQMPFGIQVISGSAPSGILTHHGDWEGRTTSGSPTPPDYIEMTPEASSSLDNSYATLSLPQQESGSIFDLQTPSNLKAFDRVLDEIKKIKS